MCQSCIDIDKQIEHYKELLRSIADLVEIERINQLIATLYGDRVRQHRNPNESYLQTCTTSLPIPTPRVCRV
jgi:hypothetical protein